MNEKRDNMQSTTNAGSPGTAFAARHPDGARLLADIGGTNARFALERGPGRIDAVQVLACADHAHFADALQAYLQHVDAPTIRHAAIAIANPVIGDDIRMTNHHWQFSIEATRRRFGFQTLLAANDFTALAHALPYMGASELVHVGGNATGAPGALGLVGAGTGLGVGGLIPAPNGAWSALQSEGGHSTFAPADALEVAILQYCWRTYSHVSAERLVSGPGIELTYRALCHIAGQRADELDAAGIVLRATQASDPFCEKAVNCFCAMLGTVASNVAITIGALGGVYIGGGIVPRLGPLFAASPFRSRFEHKGRFGNYLAQVPTWVISAPFPTFTGVAAMLEREVGGSRADDAVQGQTAFPEYEPATVAARPATA
jgi:glucokinase